jgi:hypothetical protein
MSFEVKKSKARVAFTGIIIQTKFQENQFVGLKIVTGR